jgi:hypothetical protein
LAVIGDSRQDAADAEKAKVRTIDVLRRLYRGPAPRAGCREVYPGSMAPLASFDETLLAKQ